VRIAYAIPVRTIERLQDGTLLAVGIETNIFTLADFPAKVTVPLIVAVACPHTEAIPGRGHRLVAQILDPVLSDAGEMTIGFDLTPGPNTPEGWEVRGQVVAIAQFMASVPGTYSIELSAAWSSQSVPIVVRKPD
jgi:hypothetical protein